MKRALIAALVVILIIIGLIGYAAYNANSLIARYQPELEQAIAKSLGKHVSLGNLNVTIFPTTAIEVGNLKISDSKDSNESLSLDNLLLRLDLLPLFSGQLVINQLELAQPHITIVKDEKGTRIVGLPSSGQSEKEAKRIAETSSDSEVRTKAPVQSPLDFKLERFLLRDATISFEDQINKKTYNATKITALVGLSLEKNTVNVPEFDLSATVLNKIKITFKGKKISYGLLDSSLNLGSILANILGNPFEISGKLDLSSKEGQVQLGSSKIDLSTLNDLGDLIPASVHALGLSGAIGSDIKARIRGEGPPLADGSIELSNISMQSGEVKISELSGKIDLSSSPNQTSIQSRETSLKLSGSPIGLKIKGHLAGDQVVFEQLQIDGFSGNIKKNGDFNLKSKNFSVMTVASNLDLKQLLRALKPNQPPLVSGTLTELQVKTAGNAGPDLLQSLNGNIALLMENGTLEGFNLAGSTLKSVKGLPFLAAALYSAVPMEYQEELGREGTAIKKLSGDFNLSGGELRTSNLTMLSNVFTLKANGIILLSGGLKLNADIIFNKDFSQAMARKAKEIQRLLNEDDQLVIPLTLQGNPPKIVVIPNTNKLAELGAKRVVKEAAQDLLNRALGGGNAGQRKSLPKFGF